MLNRRILRIKAFKTLYSSKIAGDVSLQEAESTLDASCEATRDLYLFMLGIVPPLTRVAKERIEAARRKLNPTEEEIHPNMKFADNSLSVMIDSDPDFTKLFKKKKFSWEPYDLLLSKIFSSVSGKDYYKDYMASSEMSLAADCRLFKRIFEEEFEDNDTVERILEDMSLYWVDDLAYALSHVCRTLDALALGKRWTLPPLYQSDTMTSPDAESDKQYAHKILRSAFASYDKYASMVSDALSNWKQDRIVSTDMSIIILGMAEAASCPTIPIKVTLNEYVEISKYYGTPKSGVFVNGILDSVIQKMVLEGMIVKTGKANI